MTALHKLPDYLRAGALLYGGFVVGWGILIGIGRAQQMRNRNRWLFRSTILLALAHTLITLFIAFVLIRRLGQPIRWFTPAAYVIFTVKLAFLFCLYRGAEQDARDGRYLSVSPRDLARRNDEPLGG